MLKTLNNESTHLPLSERKSGMRRKIRVLVVDDSAVVRKALTDILNSDPDIEVMATAHDPYMAAEKIRAEVPDVIMLDIEMPRMDGITFLQKLMSQHPVPVVICSALTERGSETALKALEYGAVEIIQKPKLGTRKFIQESVVRICNTVKAASEARVKRISKPPMIKPKHSADVIIPAKKSGAMLRTTDKVVVVGASTGGVEAIRIFLESMPHDAPGIVLVQHMPELFTRTLAGRLDRLCQMTVKEAENGDSVIRGRVLIAPGNSHVLLSRSGARYYIETNDGPLVNHHRPSVDVLFRSAARYAGKNSIAVIMTGMGDDGAAGMLELKNEGAYTIAQDEKTCVVFGMPMEAIKRGGVKKIKSLQIISKEVLKACV